MVLVGAGNIARCDEAYDEATARLLDSIAGTVFTAGDNVHQNGSTEDYAQCFGPSWGRHVARIRPVPGDAEYRTAGAGAYHAYFGAAAGDSTRGYYSYDLGAWHIVALNSSAPMGARSAQGRWLAADLKATTQPCVLAYWHFPRFSSFSTAVRSEVKPFWDALYAAQADVVINGHYRLYERFAPQTPAGATDAARGMRQFTVGTGGHGIDGISAPGPNSEVRSSGVFGVLKLTLSQFTYAWEFIPVAGQSFHDTGDGVCHGRRGHPPPNQAPQAGPGGPYETEATLVLDGSSSRDIDGHLPLTYAWDFGDGTTGVGALPSKTYAADGAYVASLVVTDARGLSSPAVTTTVTVGNLPPTVSVGVDTTVQISDGFLLRAALDDAGGPGDGPWTWTVAWGDRRTDTGITAAESVTVRHLFRSFGDYRVRFTARDADGALGVDEAVVNVRDPRAVVTLVGAGDITECGSDDDERTAALLDRIPGIVFTTGDNAYLSGSAEDFANCYHPTWGRHKRRTRPVVGNHDYATPGAAGYFGYFGAAAGDRDKGYYSYTAGEWLVIVLNSASGSINRRAGSDQERWLRALLAAEQRTCAVALMHHPQFTSTDGRHSGEWNVIDLWNALYDGGVELVIAGHDHLYERFTPMRPDGTPDPQRGIRQITVGTGGGEGLYQLGARHPLSESRNNTAFGVLRLTLSGKGYRWEFVPVEGQTFTDAGTGACH